MTSLSFLRQMLQDVRHQKLRTLLTLFGITWGTVSVALLVSFGEGLQAPDRKNQQRPRREHRDRLAVADVAALRGARQGPARSASPRRTSRPCAARSPRRSFSGEYMRGNSAFRRERVRISPDMSATNSVFGVMRNLIPAEGGRYVNDLDVDRRRRVVFLGDKLKQDLFGEADAVGQTVMIDNVPFLVDRGHAEEGPGLELQRPRPGQGLHPRHHLQGLFGERYVEQLHLPGEGPALVPAVTKRVYEVLGRRLKFDPNDKEAIGMWDTTEGEKFIDDLLRHLPRLPGRDRLLHPDRGRHRRLEHHVRRGRGADARDRRQAGGGRQAPLHPEPVPDRDADAHRRSGACSASSSPWASCAVFPCLGLDEYVGTPEASPVVIVTTALLWA